MEKSINIDIEELIFAIEIQKKIRKKAGFPAKYLFMNSKTYAEISCSKLFTFECHNWEEYHLGLKFYIDNTLPNGFVEVR